jgi:hypothetical protein
MLLTGGHAYREWEGVHLCGGWRQLACLCYGYGMFLVIDTVSIAAEVEAGTKLEFLGNLVETGQNLYPSTRLANHKSVSFFID